MAERVGRGGPEPRLPTIRPPRPSVFGGGGGGGGQIRRKSPPGGPSRAAQRAAAAQGPRRTRKAGRLPRRDGARAAEAGIRGEPPAAVGPWQPGRKLRDKDHGCGRLEPGRTLLDMMECPHDGGTRHDHRDVEGRDGGTRPTRHDGLGGR